MEFISFITSISVLIFSLTTKLLCTNMSMIAVMALSPSLPVSLSSLSSTDQSVCQWIWCRAENGEAAGREPERVECREYWSKGWREISALRGQQERLGSINKVQDRSIGSVTQREQQVTMAAPQGLFIIRLTGTENISARENCTAYNPLTSHCLSRCCFEHLCLVFEHCSMSDSPVYVVLSGCELWPPHTLSSWPPETESPADLWSSPARI